MSQVQTHKRYEVAAQEDRLCRVVHADAATARAPHRRRDRRDFGLQARRVTAQRQARAAADQGSLVEQRMAGQGEHRGVAGRLRRAW